MGAYTIPADVELPSGVGAVVHLPVPGEPFTISEQDGSGNVIKETRGTRPPPVLEVLGGKQCETCRPEPHPSGECQCVPCNSPAYGHPAHPHCAACCGGTLVESHAHNCPVGDHAEMAHLQYPTSGCLACAGSGSALVDLNRLVEVVDRVLDLPWGPEVHPVRMVKSLGRWKVKALEPDDTGGYVATLELVVAP